MKSIYTVEPPVIPRLIMGDSYGSGSSFFHGVEGIKDSIPTSLDAIVAFKVRMMTIVEI